MAMNISSPKKSPSNGEYDPAILTDTNGNQMPVFAVEYPDANSNTSLAGSNAVGETSQVTDRRQSPIVTLNGGAAKVPVIALIQLDASNNPVPFGSARKFQSTELTGTGSQQTIAHGLGVVPSAVLAAPQDNTASGSTPFTFQLVEGTHTTTNLLITATTGLKYKVIAFV